MCWIDLSSTELPVVFGYNGDIGVSHVRESRLSSLNDRDWRDNTPGHVAEDVRKCMRTNEIKRGVVESRHNYC